MSSDNEIINNLVREVEALKTRVAALENKCTSTRGVSSSSTIASLTKVNEDSETNIESDDQTSNLSSSTSRGNPVTQFRDNVSTDVNQLSRNVQDNLNMGRQQGQQQFSQVQQQGQQQFNQVQQQGQQTNQGQQQGQSSLKSELIEMLGGTPNQQPQQTQNQGQKKTLGARFSNFLN